MVRKLKGSDDSTHYLELDELAGLNALHRQASSAYVFVNERSQPFGRMGIARMIERAGAAAKLPFPVHVHVSSGKGNGYKAASALPWSCLHHEHRSLHRYVA